MKSSNLKRALSTALALAITAGVTTPAFVAKASDTLPYLGESARGENQPYQHGYRAEDFLDWSPETDPYSEYMRAQIPLQDRNEAFAATQANPELSSETQWFTLAGDYGNAFFDSYPYTNEFSQYLFNFWQLTDYYGSWHGMPTEEVPYEMYEDERGVTDAWKNRKFEFGLVNMPNPGYTNAAHKNGVLSIGCIFLPRTGLKHTMLLTQDENGNFPYADKLIEMCEYYGFDGWFINQEESIPQEDVALYKKFMKQMRDAGLYIQWYDAITDTSGGLSYQNEFNSANDSYFYEDDETVAPVGTQYADSLFLNYWWNHTKLTNSADLANSLGLNPLQVVFAGIEAGGDRWGQNYDLRNNLGEDGQPMNSIASLGSEFVHDGLDEDLDNGANDNIAMRREKDEFQWMTFERERRWWSGPFQDPSKASSSADRSTYPQNEEIGVGTRENQNFDGVAAYITERSVINGDTFVTNFNTGHGLEYMVDGELSSDAEWSNIIIQDILPTWQWWVETDSQNPLSVDFDYGTKYKKNYDNGKEDVLGKEGSFDFDLVGAYNGGSSLVLYGNVDAENFLHLYKTDLDVNESSKMDVTFKKTSDDDAALKLGVIFENSPETVVKFDIANSSAKSDEWVTSSVDLSEYAGEKIAAFGLVVDGQAADYQMNIGQMDYTSGDAIVPDAPTGLTIDKAYDTGEMTISWDKAPYDDVKQYNVYAVKDGKEIFLGGTYDEVFYIKDINEAIAEAEASYVDSVKVSPEQSDAEVGDVIDFDAEVNGYNQENGQVTIMLKAVSKDGTESEGAMESHNYNQAVSNVQVTAEDGKLNVTWEGGEADVAVKKEYSTDDRTWTASGNNGCTVEVPTGAEADHARYTMTITTKDGAVTTYDGRMDDSYSRPYTGKISGANGALEVPLSKDWYQMVYTTVTDGQESAEKTVTRYQNDMPRIASSVDTVKVKLIDYRGNESEVVEISNGSETAEAVQDVQTNVMMQVDTAVQNNDKAATETVAPDSGLAVSQEVTWTVEGATSADTKIDENGKLSVGTDESAKTLTVRATSVADSSRSGVATIRVKGVTTVLETVIEKAEQMKADGALDNTMQAVVDEFNAALEEAKALVEQGDASQSELNASAVRLLAAMAKVDWKQGDKTILEVAVDVANSINENLDQYVEEGKQEFIDALANAKALLESGNAWQDDIDAATDALIEAMSNLRMAPNKDILNDMIANAQTIDLDAYTADSAAALNAALANAQAVAADENATQEEVDAAADSLKAAMSGLVFVDGDHNNEANTNDTTADNTTTTPVGDGTTPTKTGDAGAASLAALALLSAGAVIVFKKRK